MIRVRKLFIAVSIAAAIGPALSCKREERSFHVPAPAAEASEAVTALSVLRPGPTASGTPSTSRPVDIKRTTSEPYGRLFPDNAQSQSDGQTLYFSFNCVGCHARGGGGMGPPLMDEKWLYGSEPENVYTSILEGRPNGMPSFRGRIVDSQIWALTAYVRSKSGLTNPNAASGRTDQMRAETPPNSMSKPVPVKQPPPPEGGQK